MPKKVTTSRNRLIAQSVGALLIALFLTYYIYHHYQSIQLPSLRTKERATNTTENIPDTKSDSQDEILDNYDSTNEKPAEIPRTFLIDVPFTSQAPMSNWDAEHEDACEEASLVMLKYWMDKKTFYSKEAADADIVALLEYEKSVNLGKSITLSELETIAKNFYEMTGISTETIKGIADIKRIIATGSPVIVGAAGKLLPNPNFRNGGPNYHMLLIKGYDEDGFITNDPGTRKGEGFYYKNNELFGAIHDWNNLNILSGEKNVLYINI